MANEKGKIVAGGYKAFQKFKSKRKHRKKVLKNGGELKPPAK